MNAHNTWCEFPPEHCNQCVNFQFKRLKMVCIAVHRTQFLIHGAIWELQAGYQYLI